MIWKGYSNKGIVVEKILFKSERAIFLLIKLSLSM